MTQLTTEQYWTVSSETGRFVGPFNQTDLNRLVAEGRLTTKSPVFKSATRKWTELGCVLSPPDSTPCHAPLALEWPSNAWDDARRPPRQSLPLGFVAAFASGAILAGLLAAWTVPRHEQMEELSLNSKRDLRAVAVDPRASAHDFLGAHDRGPSTFESPFLDLANELQSPHVDLSGVDENSGQQRSKSANLYSEAPPQDSTEDLDSASSVTAPDATNGHDRRAAGSEGLAERLPQYRKWHDNTGQYSTMARLVGVNGSSVSLLKPNGRIIGVDRARLSEADWLYTEAVEGRWEDQNGPEVLVARADPVEKDPATRLTAIATSRQPGDPPLQVGRIRSKDEVDRDRFAAYLDRRDERRVYATERLRQIHSMSGPHIYRTAVYAPVNALGGSAIQNGWVYQPPIARSWYRPYRPYRSIPSCSPRRVDSRQYYGYSGF